MPCGAIAAVPESSEPIVLALHEWTGQQVTTHLAGTILATMGYSVRYITAGAYTAAIPLAHGELSASLELWSNNLGEHYSRLLAAGEIERLGDLGLDPKEGWMYPLHMQLRCLGLPAWRAFIDCASEFATPETWPKGRFVDYPAEWGQRASTLINEEELPFATTPGGSEGAMLAELRSAVARRSPLVMMFWAPHWVLSKVEHGWVEIPEALRTRYGLEQPTIFKAAWPGLRQRWPAAHRLLTAFRLDNDTQQRLVDRIDNGSERVADVTGQWVAEHRQVWSAWVH
ncbi:MAG: ABC transporter substrate-binding protein [Gammaproteobacteria bacterium]|nr:ABC transporter substrate-binding protein [Gammaproteobacteria bacterium]